MSKSQQPGLSARLEVTIILPRHFSIRLGVSINIPHWLKPRSWKFDAAAHEATARYALIK
jgi:hypothetical protein